MVIDESHSRVPQLRGMYRGDRSRKQTLVDYGFRLPSALDNRPLNFEEFEARVGQVIYVSATPGPYELQKAGGRGGGADHPAHRPHGPAGGRSGPSRARWTTSWARSGPARSASERVLVTTLTKRMAEDLTEYYHDLGLRVRYLHSDIDTLERMEILRDLRLGEFDVLVGINLLREGLDLPEVSLVAILDADKEGFLRSAGSLIQTCGRAARNIVGPGHPLRRPGDRLHEGRPSGDEPPPRASRRPTTEEHGITPETIKKNIGDLLSSVYEMDYVGVPELPRKGDPPEDRFRTVDELEKEIKSLEKEMRQLAKSLEFEKAAAVRDRIRQLRDERVRPAVAGCRKTILSPCAHIPALPQLIENQHRATGIGAHARGQKEVFQHPASPPRPRTDRPRPRTGR